MKPETIITLRDHYAAAALTGLLSSHSFLSGDLGAAPPIKLKDEQIHTWITMAFSYADMMIEERHKNV